MVRLLIILLLSGCTTGHQLRYTKASDPIWPANPAKWTGNEITQAPTLTAGRIPHKESDGHSN